MDRATKVRTYKCPSHCVKVYCKTYCMAWVEVAALDAVAYIWRLLELDSE